MNTWLDFCFLTSEQPCWKIHKIRNKSNHYMESSWSVVVMSWNLTKTICINKLSISNRSLKKIAELRKAESVPRLKFFFTFSSNLINFYYLLISKLFCIWERVKWNSYDMPKSARIFIYSNSLLSICLFCSVFLHQFFTVSPITFPNISKCSTISIYLPQIRRLIDESVENFTAVTVIDSWQDIFEIPCISIPF